MQRSRTQMSPSPNSSIFLPAERSSPGGLRQMFQPAPPAAIQIMDPDAVAAGYRRWQMRVLILTIFGYAMFYFVRKNLGVEASE
jgi:hypothetical protein